jgi:type II secretory pathway component PulF
MWWKLGGLFVLAAALCVSVIPFRTHAVMYDPSNPPAPWTLRAMLANMYLTPTAGLLIAAIVAVASFVAWKVLRGQW